MFCLLQLGDGHPDSASRPESLVQRGVPEPEWRGFTDAIMRSTPTAQLPDGRYAEAAGPVTSIDGIESPRATSGRFAGSGPAYVAPLESAP